MPSSLNTTDEIFHDIAGVGSGEEKGRRDSPVALSVVLPFRNERGNLPELLQRLRASLEGAELSYELIFVDDGSTDDGFRYLAEQGRSDARIKALQLSRNFGQHVAATAGIDTACGTMIVWMDTDLQERPEDIPRFVAKHREGYDVVYARRTLRRQPPLRKLASHLFMWILARLSGLKNTSTNRPCLCLFSAQVADSIRALPERNRFLGYLMSWTGYRTTEIEIEIDERRHGKTNYSWASLIKLGLTGITSFSVAPLRISALCSCVALLGCVMGVLWVMYKYFFLGIGVSGWASLIIALLMLHAMQFAVLAILGEYIGLTYTEAKRRPLYFCARTVNLSLLPLKQEEQVPQQTL